MSNSASTLRSLSQRDGRLGTLRAPFVIDTLTDGIETLQLARGMMAVYTVSGIPVYNGPADDFHRQQVRRGEHYHKE